LDSFIYFAVLSEHAHGTGEVRTTSGVAARSGRLATSGQRKDGRHHTLSFRRRRCIRSDRRRLSRETVAPQGPAYGVDKHDGQLRDEIGHYFGLRHGTGQRLHKTPSGTMRGNLARAKQHIPLAYNNIIVIHNIRLDAEPGVFIGVMVVGGTEGVVLMTKPFLEFVF